MLAEKALSLVKEVHQGIDTLLPYNTELVQEISREIMHLTQDNQRLVQVNNQDTMSYLPTIDSKSQGGQPPLASPLMFCILVKIL
ncbi:hypothetical protein CBL_00591 [Carabus blaptoides fortunei]